MFNSNRFIIYETEVKEGNSFFKKKQFYTSSLLLIILLVSHFPFFLLMEIAFF
jgi:hypothetical protein